MDQTGGMCTTHNEQTARDTYCSDLAVIPHSILHQSTWYDIWHLRSICTPKFNTFCFMRESGKFPRVGFATKFIIDAVVFVWRRYKTYLLAPVYIWILQPLDKPWPQASALHPPPPLWAYLNLYRAEVFFSVPTAHRFSMNFVTVTAAIALPRGEQKGRHI